MVACTGNTSLFTYYEDLAYEAGESRFSRSVNSQRAAAYAVKTQAAKDAAEVALLDGVR